MSFFQFCATTLLKVIVAQLLDTVLLDGTEPLWHLSGDIHTFANDLVDLIQIVCICLFSISLFSV